MCATASPMVKTAVVSIYNLFFYSWCIILFVLQTGTDLDVFLYPLFNHLIKRLPGSRTIYLVYSSTCIWYRCTSTVVLALQYYIVPGIQYILPSTLIYL